MRGHALESSSLSSSFLDGISALRGSFDAEADQSGFANNIFPLLCSKPNELFPFIFYFFSFQQYLFPSLRLLKHASKITAPPQKTQTLLLSYSSVFLRSSLSLRFFLAPFPLRIFLFFFFFFLLSFRLHSSKPSSTSRKT